MSRRMATPAQSVPGGMAMWSRYSMGTPSTFALVAVSLLTSRRPVVIRTYRGVVLSATAWSLGRRRTRQPCGQHFPMRTHRDQPNLRHQRISRGADRTTGYDARRGAHLPLQELDVRL